MKNIHLLPTPNSSRLVKNSNENTLKLCIQTLPLDEELGCIPQNIYITNDEEIKKGDWILSGNKIYQIKESAKDFLNHVQGISRKIILTTDQDLIKEFEQIDQNNPITKGSTALVYKQNVQSIPDDFLEWFVNNSSCEYVEVNLNSFGECHMKGDGCSCYDTTDQSLCELHYPNYKIIIPKEEPKQETLYEAAEKYAEHQLTGIDDKFSKFECINDFIAGAEFQQQQDKNKFSEEDMKLAFETGRNFQLTGENNFNELIEQFKKK